MSPEGEAPVNRRGEPRVPFDGAVRLRYRLFQEFLEENAANISSGGMFIRTIHPGEPAGFEPPDGLGRAAWEAARRARIERPRWIRVALTLVEVEPDGPDAAEVRFVQSYRSERYKDLVRKRMRLVREDGGWKIAAENSLGR